jgi:hypothetical protein
MSQTPLWVTHPPARIPITTTHRSSRRSERVITNRGIRRRLRRGGGFAAAPRGGGFAAPR